MSPCKWPTSKLDDTARTRKKQVRKHVLTPVEREFCAFVAQGVSLREAARLCGMNEKNVGHIIKRPLVQEHLQALKVEITKGDARRVSEFVNITRNEIIGGLARLAKIHPMVTHGISGQVSAYMGLAKIMGMLIDRQVNLDEFFRGWTDDELLEYATTGKRPARYATGESQGAQDLGTPAVP
jgi:DNA-binding CsgD family transcriptional regulator